MSELSVNFVSVLRCLRCEGGAGQIQNGRNNNVICMHCGASYDVHSAIPSMVFSGPKEQDWNPWDLDSTKMIGDSYYKRANGDLPEKESSISYANFIMAKSLYDSGDSVLDLGCATGHFLRSFRRIIDHEIDYTGIDATEEYLLWGKKIFGVDDKTKFVHGDVLNMPFIDSSFDIVVVNLFHFFPDLKQALSEAIRVGRKWVIWRTPIGQVNYLVKILLNQQSYEDLGDINFQRNDLDHCVYMLYHPSYIEGIVCDLGAKVEFIIRDEDYSDFDNNMLPEFSGIPATKTFHGIQLNGNLHLDWHYVGIRLG